MHNMTFGSKYFVHFSGCRLFAHNMEKIGVTLCKEMTILTNFIRYVACFVVLTQNRRVDPRFILNNKFWNKFLLGPIGIVREVLQKLVHSSGVTIRDTIWQTLRSYAEMHKIFIAQKSYCACRVLSLAAIRSMYYFNFILNRTRSGRELFDHPSYLLTLHIVSYVSV